MKLCQQVLPYRRLIAVTVLICVCSSIQNGYISSVLNIPQVVIEKFVNGSHHRQHAQFLSASDETWLWSFIVSQRQIGQLIGTLLTPFMCGALGCKGTLLLNTIFLSTGLFLQTTSNFFKAWELLFVGRLVWAVGCGVVAVVVPMFISEIAPNAIRGRMASVHGMMLGFGSLIADIVGLSSVLGNENLWSYAYLIALCIQLVQLVILPYCPESPKDLYMRQKKLEATMVSLRFYHDNLNPAQLEDILHEYNKEQQAGGFDQKQSPFAQMVCRKDLRMSMVVGIGATACYAFGGMQIVTNYTTELFQSVGVEKQTAEHCSLILGAIRFVAVFPSMYMVEKYGRRPLLLTSVWGCILAFVINMILFLVYEHVTRSGVIGYFVVVCTLFYGIMFSVGPQTIGTFYPAEVVPTQQRAANQSVAIMFRFIFALATTLSFLPLQRSIDGFCWLSLIIPLIFTAIFMQKCMPETKDRAVVDILHELNTRRNIFRRCRLICTDGVMLNDDLEELEPLLHSEVGHEKSNYV